MHKLKTAGLITVCCLVNIFVMAQDKNNITTEEPTDFMHSNGKIYVVVAVAAIIITGLFLYVLNLDRKIKRLEKENKG
jgi:CcmD family protein